MANAGIVFDREKDGYDKRQVDSYINRLSLVYQDAYNENLSLREQHESLLELFEKSKKSAAQERKGINSDIAVKTLKNAEILAYRIIADAQEQAAQILMGAKKGA